MTIPIIIATTILATYTITLCVVNRGIPKSLSATVFNLPPTGAWLWTLIITGVTFTIMPAFIEAVSEETKFLAFIACGGLLLVAVCPLVRDKGNPAYKTHIVGAYTSAVASQVCIAMNQWLLILMWIPWIFAFSFYHNRGKKWDTAKFWAEITCFATPILFCFRFI